MWFKCTSTDWFCSHKSQSPGKQNMHQPIPAYSTHQYYSIPKMSTVLLFVIFISLYVDHNVLIKHLKNLVGISDVLTPVHLLSVKQVLLRYAWRCSSLLWAPPGVYSGSPPIYHIHATPGANPA